jgi:hypothetical protein
MLFALQSLNLTHHPIRFFLGVERAVNREFFAAVFFRPESFGGAPEVVSDHTMRCIENVLRGAIILLQTHDLRVGIELFKVENDFDIGAAPGVNRVVNQNPIRREIAREGMSKS